MAAAQKLRAQLAKEGNIVVCPGVFDGLTARIALKAGFETLYMVWTEASPSLPTPTLDMEVRDVPSKHVLYADALAGPLMVGRTTEQYIRAGVAALHLEDQVVNKRCGHLLNKEIVEEAVYLSRIKAAVNAREACEGDIVIIARTDALQSLGYEAAVSRLKKAIAIGADVAFLEGFGTKEEGMKVCEELAPTPVLLNMVSGGVTPNYTVDQAREAGFKVIIFPGFALGAVYRAVTLAAEELKATGSMAKVEAGDAAFGPKQLFMVCGLQESMDFDIAAGGNMYEKGV